MAAVGCAVTAGRDKPVIRAYAEAALIAILLGVAVRGFAIQAFAIPSASMLPTLEIGDYLLVDRLHYGVPRPIVGGWLATYATPRPGDVIVFGHPADQMDFVKRVIAVGGETVEIRDKRVFVDGRPRDVTAAFFAEGLAAPTGAVPRDNFGPIRVPPGRLFVMGDNRDFSQDSRFWGLVSTDEITGKAMLIYWSWDQRDGWVRWDRIGRWVH